MDIFQFVDRVKPEPCLMNDELYLEKRRWFRWDQIQSLPLDVAYLKAVFGDHISLSVHFVGSTQGWGECEREKLCLVCRANNDFPYP